MITTYFLNCVLGNVMGSQTTPSVPAAYYVGLSSTAPTVDGENVTEPTGGSYRRVQVTRWTAPADGVVTNGERVVFPESTADWGTLTHTVLFDSATGGNLVAYDALSKPKTIQSEVQASFAANTLKMQLNATS